MVIEAGREDVPTLIPRNRGFSVSTICPECHKPFTVNRTNYDKGQRHCSRACRIVSSQIDHPCNGCGKSLRLTATQFNNGRRYCTTACRSAAYKVNNTRHIDTVCPGCGVSFMLTASQFNGGRRFCSPECRAGRIEKACEWCRRPFFPLRSSHQQRYCCARCARLGVLPVATLSETEAAYLAGIVDGEGTIGIYRCTTDTRSLTNLRLAVVVVNTTAAVMAWMAAKTGLSTYREETPRKAHHKPRWTLAMQGMTALGVLRRISPYLIVKRPQADVAFRYYAIMEQYPDREGHALYRVPPQALPLLEACRDEIRRLNHRGPLPGDG